MCFFISRLKLVRPIHKPSIPPDPTMEPSDDSGKPASHQPPTSTSSLESTIGTLGTSPKWQPNEEKRAVRKIDMTVLPLLFLGLLVFQLDRMNLASALTGGFREAINIDQSTINLGNQMMFIGVIVFEIPLNMLLQRVGPRKWIPAQVLIFGITATMQIFIRDRNGFLVMRAMLGLAEASYIPSSIYTLSTWYRKRELGTRVAVFFFGMFGGNALSPVLASGILRLEGVRGIAGWQWLFLLEGVLTTAVGFVLLLILPGSPDEPRPLLKSGLVAFTEKDLCIIRERLEDDDSKTRTRMQAIPWKLVRQTVLHYKRWPSYLSTFCVFATWSPLTTYTPSIFVSLGFDRTTANALAAIGASLALVVVFAFARLSDRTNRRGLCVILAQVCYLVTLVVARQVQPTAGRWGKWGLWTAVNAFAVGYHPIHNTCECEIPILHGSIVADKSVGVQLNCKYPGERSIAIAMWVMLATSGLMVGTQLFQGSDAPYYSNGLLYMVALVTIGIGLAALQEAVYIMHNRHVRQGRGALINGEAEPRVYVP
jgi:MFS family permease